MEHQNLILLVDDDEPLRTALSGEMKDAGFDVETADDGDTAISKLKEKRFTLVLLDIKMPRVTGMEVLKFIRQNMPSTKVIVLTAVSDLKTAIEAKKLGAEDFIEKPYILDEVMGKVRQLTR